MQFPCSRRGHKSFGIWKSVNSVVDCDTWTLVDERISTAAAPRHPYGQSDSCSCRTLFNLLISINRHITSLLLLLHSINARLPLGMWFTQFSDWQTNLSDCYCFCPIHNNFSFYSPFTHNYYTFVAHSAENSPEQPLTTGRLHPIALLVVLFVFIQWARLIPYWGDTYYYNNANLLQPPCLLFASMWSVGGGYIILCT